MYLDPELFLTENFQYLLRNSKYGITIKDLMKIPMINPLKVERDDWSYIIGSKWASSKFIGIDGLRGNSPFIAFVLKPVTTLNLCDPICDTTDRDTNYILTFTFNRKYEHLNYYVHVHLPYKTLAITNDELLTKCEQLLKYGWTKTADDTIWMLENKPMNYPYMWQRYWKMSVVILTPVALFIIALLAWLKHHYA